MYNNGVQAKAHCYNVGKDASNHRRGSKRQVPKVGCGDSWCSQVHSWRYLEGKRKIEPHISASSNSSYVKKRCIVRDAHFQKFDDIFPELRTFLSYGHCPLPWCPDKGGFTVIASGIQQ